MKKPTTKPKILETGTVAIADIRPWDKNPRTTGEQEIANLAEQIKDLGSYKPVIVTTDGIIVGGNARYLALRALGEANVWVSIVRADTDAEKLFFALSDNDIVGITEKDKLMALLGEVSPQAISKYTVDFGFGQPLANILETAGLDVGDAEAGMANIEKIILPFANADFELVMAFLQRVMDDHDLESNTDAVIHLLNEYAVA